MYEHFFKRAIDFTISLIAITLLSPLILVLYALVKVKIGNPVIFKQIRPGKNEVLFEMYKFRTMTNETDENGNLLADKCRLTSFGKLLRETSLDELPELFNILRGEMSLVGPRPQLVKDMVFMNKTQRNRHQVRQGLTGLAQINGRNNITWEQKIEYDLEYIENITFTNDVKILFLTVAKVFKKEGINSSGVETAEDFGDYLLRNNKVANDEYVQKVKESISLCKKMERRGK